jgi:hypothetical protein
MYLSHLSDVAAENAANAANGFEMAEKGQVAKGFENCWRGGGGGGADGAKGEAGGKTLPHAAGGLELNMEALPKEFEAIAVAAENAANAANGFEMAEKGQVAKGFENC